MYVIFNILYLYYISMYIELRIKWKRKLLNLALIGNGLKTKL